MDALGSERFIRSPSLRLFSDTEDKDSDGELGKGNPEDYSPELYENKIVNCRVNKDAEDEIDQLKGIFRSSVRKIINGETGVLNDETPRVDKGKKLQILMTVVHHSSISSKNPSHHEEVKKTVVQLKFF